MNLRDGRYITTPKLCPTIERTITIRNGKVIIHTTANVYSRFKYSQSEFFAANKLIRSS